MQLLVFYPMEGTRSAPPLCAAYSDLIPQFASSTRLTMCHRAPEGVGEGRTPTQPLHTLGHHLRVEQCAVPLFPELQGCSVLSSPPLFSTHKSATPNPLPPCCIPHCRLVPPKVSTQQQCAEVSELRASAPSAHPDVCAESRSLGQDAHGRHSLS